MKKWINKKMAMVFWLVAIWIGMSFSGFEAAASQYKQTAAIVSEDIVIKVNDEVLPFKAVIVESKTYLPVRVFSRALNADIRWKDSDRSITVTPLKNPIRQEKFEDLENLKGNKVAYFVDDIKFVLGTVVSESQSDFTATYEELSDISAQVIIIEDRSYLPIRAITEKTGIRVQWDGKKREVRIVNPNTVKVDPIHQDLYVKDLPKIEKEEDYLIGNWRGKDTFDTNSYPGNPSVISLQTDSYYYISRQKDGTYNVYQANIFNDPKFPAWNGMGYKIEWKNVSFNSQTKELMLRTNLGKCIESTCPIAASEIYASNIGPKLIGDTLSADYGKKREDVRFSYYERF